MKHSLIRDIRFEELLETFFVSAIASILVIRTFLSLTGYPHLGEGELHIAHILWGGLMMFLSVAVVLTLLNNGAKKLAAILGGIGFGTFIDELGKFITSDNNYFYRPTFSIIYVIFILFYLVFSFFRRRVLREEEYLANSIELLKEAVINDLDQDERKEALDYLNKSDKNNKIVIFLRRLYADMETIPAPEKSFLQKLQSGLEKYYFALIKNPGFDKLVVGFFLLRTFVYLSSVFLFLAGGIFWFFSPSSLSFSLNLFDSPPKIFSFLSGTIEGVLIVLGALGIRGSRLDAYVFFRRSILVSIFVGQIFLFYQNQLAALSGLVLDLIVLNVLNYMIGKERIKSF